MAVLDLWPAALSHDTAVHYADDRVGRLAETVHVAVGRHRSVEAPDGVRLHHRGDLDEVVRWNLSPPRVGLEHALLDVAAAAGDEVAVVAILADAVQARRTTAARLLATAGTRPRLPRRALITAVLTDIRSGTGSALEHAYLDQVERPHGLPRGVRQAAGPGGWRDVEYAAYGVIVELDRRAFHDDDRRRDRDLGRDLAAALSGKLTLRLGWGQVVGRGCLTARQVGEVLRSRGWDGSPHPCPACPTIAAPHRAA